MLRRTGFEKKAHLINFSTKKNINVEIFYSFLTAALFEGKYIGHLSEEILEMMLPNDYDSAERLEQKFPEAAKKFSGKLIKKRGLTRGNHQG